MRACRRWVGIACLLSIASGCGSDEPYYLKNRKKRPSDSAEPAVVKQDSSKVPAKNDANTASEKSTTAGVPPASAKVDISSVNWKDPTIALPVELQLTEVQARERAILQMTKIHAALESLAKKNGAYTRPIHREMSGKPGLSWRVLILAELGYTELSAKFAMREAWDGPINRKLIKQIPGVYQSPHRRDERTNYQYLMGSGTLFAKPFEMIEPDSVIDGVKNSILVVEVDDAHACPWTKPEDYEFSPTTVQKDLFSLRKDSSLAIFGETVGVRQIPANISDASLTALITSAGGERISSLDATLPPTPKPDANLIAELEKTPIVRFSAGATVETSSATTANKTTPAKPESVAEAEKGTTSTAGTTTPEAMTSPVAATETQDNRLPIPSDEELAAAGALMKKGFGEEYSAAKSAVEKSRLARKLFDAANKGGLDLAGSYVLLRASRDIASQAGDTVAALSAIEKMAAIFRVDPVPVSLQVLEAGMNSDRPSTEMQAMFDVAQHLCLQSLNRDDFANAKQFLSIGQTLARRMGRRDLMARVNAGQNYLTEAKRKHELVSTHMLTLLRTPDDATANAIVGRYLCLTKQDWNQGLARVVRGADSELKSLAQKEAAAPQTAEEQLALADQWWEFGESLSNQAERMSVRIHAGPWYEMAVKDLPPGLARTIAEKRLSEIRKLRPSSPSDRSLARRNEEE